jgi:hypothetical protein
MANVVEFKDIPTYKIKDLFMAIIQRKEIIRKI